MERWLQGWHTKKMKSTEQKTKKQAWNFKFPMPVMWKFGDIFKFFLVPGILRPRQFGAKYADPNCFLQVEKSEMRPSLLRSFQL